MDAWLTPIVMKKGRLATKLSAIVKSGKKDEIAGIILKETSSIGLRINSIDRIEAQRKVEKIKTVFGEINVKLAFKDGEIVNVAPELDDCKAIAEKRGIPLKKVCQEVLIKALKYFSEKNYKL